MSNVLESGAPLLGEADWAAAFPRQSDAEEFVNSLTHGAGLALSVAGGVALLRQSVGTVNAGLAAACGLYVFSLVGVYAMSFLSHACQRPRWKRRFRTLDQAFIYCLIAGTYAPPALLALGSEGWWLAGSMWAVAAIGFGSKVLLHHRVENVSIVLYLMMAWLPLLAAGRVLHQMPDDVCRWVIAGGLSYTLGTVFLTLDQRVRYFHAVWHVLVMIGSASHFFAILAFVRA